VGHVPPPQSTSVSWPFRTPSEQVGAWHIPLVHTPLAQSLFFVHMLELTTVMAQFAVAVPAAVPVESITLAVKLAVPVAFGVPVMTPLEAFSINPPGRLPEEMEKVSGGAPPVDPTAEV
jgi:hypothetical protein